MRYESTLARGRSMHLGLRRQPSQWNSAVFAEPRRSNDGSRLDVQQERSESSTSGAEHLLLKGMPLHVKTTSGNVKSSQCRNETIKLFSHQMPRSVLPKVLGYLEVHGAAFIVQDRIAFAVSEFSEDMSWHPMTYHKVIQASLVLAPVVVCCKPQCVCT